jgi:hypothetical protein
MRLAYSRDSGMSYTMDNLNDTGEKIKCMISYKMNSIEKDILFVGGNKRVFNV